MNEKVYIAVKTRNESTRFDVEELFIVEKRLRKLVLMTYERDISYYEKLKNVAPLLGSNFFQVKRGCFINLEMMITASEGVLLFENGYKLCLGRKSFIRAKQKHNSYYKTKQMLALKKVAAENGLSRDV